MRAVGSKNDSSDDEAANPIKEHQAACCTLSSCQMASWNGQEFAFCSHECRVSSLLERSMSKVTQVVPLQPGDPTFESVRLQFVGTWDEERCPAPSLRVVYEIVPPIEVIDSYLERQRAVEAVGPGRRNEHSRAGNENRRWHGTSMRCTGDFLLRGRICGDEGCGICRIIETARFRMDKAGDNTGGGKFGDGLYFTSRASTAKGYGLAKGLRAPPENVEDFVSPGAGNALLLCGVLVGRCQLVRRRTKECLPDAFHSRVVGKSSGVDELVVFSEDQVMPMYLVIV